MDFNSIAFLFDGRRIHGEQTPDEVSHPLFSHTHLHNASYIWPEMGGTRE